MMKLTSLPPAMEKALGNEIDYLNYLGLNTGLILRYIAVNKNVDEPTLARTLGITADEVSDLKNKKEALPSTLKDRLRTII